MLPVHNITHLQKQGERARDDDVFRNTLPPTLFRSGEMLSWVRVENMYALHCRACQIRKLRSKRKSSTYFMCYLTNISSRKIDEKTCETNWKRGWSVPRQVTQYHLRDFGKVSHPSAKHKHRSDNYSNERRPVSSREIRRWNKVTKSKRENLHGRVWKK